MPAAPAAPRPAPASVVELPGPSHAPEAHEPARFRIVRLFVAIPMIALSAVALFPLAVIPVSSQAVVNARLSRVKAPIDGNLQTVSFETGDLVTTNEPMAEIRALPSAVNAQTMEYTRQEREIQARSYELEAELAAGQGRLSRYSGEASKYAQHLASDLQAQVQLADQERETRVAEQSTLEDELKRDTRAVQDHLMPRSMLDQVTEKVERARANAQSASLALDQLRRQITDVKAGYLLGNSAQTPPSLEQRDQAQADIDRVTQQKHAVDAQLTELRTSLSARTKMLSGMTTVRSPVSGPIWARAAAPSQSVIEGDDLFRVADSSSIHVEVWLDRRYGPQLSIGDVALVYLSGMGKELSGKVISFQGTSRRRLDEEINAIDLQPVHPDQYHVTIELDAADRKAVYIGQAAKVLFPGAKGQFRASVYKWLTRL